jgi:hypothetical protein
MDSSGRRSIELAHCWRTVLVKGTRPLSKDDMGWSGARKPNRPDHLDHTKESYYEELGPFPNSGNPALRGRAAAAQRRRCLGRHSLREREQYQRHAALHQLVRRHEPPGRRGCRRVTGYNPPRTLVVHRPSGPPIFRHRSSSPARTPSLIPSPARSSFSGWSSEQRNQPMKTRAMNILNHSRTLAAERGSLQTGECARADRRAQLDPGWPRDGADLHDPA